jgi:hypothetical protein
MPAKLHVFIPLAIKTAPQNTAQCQTAMDLSIEKHAA